MQLLITLAIAVVGGLLAKKCRVPAGAMIGAMIAVAAFNIITGEAFLPSEVKVIVQIIAGIFIGVGVRKKDVLALKRMLLPAVIAVAAVILLTFVMGMLLFYFTDFDLVTALFSCAPGGLVDITLISYDMGADTSIVSVLQLVRLMSVMALFPPAISRIVRFYEKRNNTANGGKPALSTSSEDGETAAEPTNHHGVKEMLLTFAVGGFFGVLGWLSGVPAGTIVFSMVGVAAQNILFGNAYMPAPVKTGAQICSGTLIGEGITMAAVVGLQDAVIPALCFLVGYLLISIFLSLLLFRFTKLDIGTAFFCCAPGGLSDLTLIAGDLGADVAKVTVFQLLRSVSVIALYPIIVSGVMSLFPGI